MTRHHRSDLAWGKMQIARARMARAYPFHAAVIGRARVEEDEAVQTMGVTVRGGNLCLLYAPGFVDLCSFDQLVGLLHHEVNHVLFGHLFLDPRRYPDADALLVAEEVTANEWVTEPLPGEPITLAGYPELPPGEGTEERYARLARQGQESGPGESNPGREAPKSTPRGRKLGPSGPKNGPPGTESGPPGTENSHARPLDDHGVWAEARAAGPYGEMAVRVAVRAAARTLTPEQEALLPAPLREQIDRTCRGDRPGDRPRDVAGPGRRGAVDWRRVLRRHVARAVARRPAFDRPPRRFPGLVGVVPGHARRAGEARVMAVIDTSGSIGDADLADIGAELVRLARDHEVVVVECDARVRATYRFRGQVRQVRGGGGTDLRPPLAAAVLRSVRPDVVVYFTDGRGPAPERGPRTPVIWCLVPGGEAPAAWGQVVRMAEGERRPGKGASRTKRRAP
jgi:predicted metal-dependent peptidase